MPMTDQEILARVRRGDRNAFGQLVEKYKAAVFAVALHHTRDERDVSDGVQEIFLNADIRK